MNGRTDGSLNGRSMNGSGGGWALHTDKYQINMMYAHWVHGTHNDRAVFDLYFRKPPFGGGFAVCAGLERVVRYVRELRFGDEEIAYLAEQE